MDNTVIIENLLHQKESNRLAFVATADYESVCRTATAMVNNEGGDIIIGVDDKTKEVTGITDEEEIRTSLSQKLSSSIKPIAPFSVTPFYFKGKILLLVSTWPGSNKPYSYNNNIFTRTENLTLLANNEAVNGLIQTRKNSSFHWERQTVLGVEIDDLDEEELRKTIAKYNKDQNSIDFNADIEEFLTYMGLLVNGNLTNAAILLFAKRPARYLPQCKIRVTAFDGEKSGKTILYDQQFEGNIFKNIEDIWSFLTITFGRSSQIKDFYRTGRSNYPQVALREGLMNAIVHRDYSSVAGTLQILLYRDRLEIINSGALPSGISIQDLRKEHFSILRNPDIAQLCYIRGYIEMLGSGTLRMISDCVEHRFLEPKWRTGNNMTTLTFPGLTAMGDTSHEIQNQVHEDTFDTANERRNEVVNEEINEGIKRELEKTAEKIKANSGLRTNELAKMLNKGVSTVERYIKLLKQDGIVEFRGAPKTGGYYFISRKSR